MSRFEKAQVREAPALFCARCREWKRASLAEIIAAYTVPALRSFWECRPEGVPTDPPVTPLKKGRKIKGLQTNFDAIGGRRKGRPGRPRKPSKASLDGRVRRP